jgi:hypothetical protein
VEGGDAALALLDGERERAAHVLEALLLAEVGAGCAAVAERARRLGQAELIGERNRHRIGYGGERVGKQGP